MLFQDYECVLATHTDTDTVHSHIIVNAVDPLTGKKLQFSPKDYIAMKDEVNRLGKEHGYTETDFRKRGKNSRTAAEREIMFNGGVSRKEELREVIVEAIGKSHNEQEFKDYLKECYVVEITRSGKDYSYLHPQKQKPIRGEKLGTNYTKSEVIRKIGEQNNRMKSQTESMLNELKEKIRELKELSTQIRAEVSTVTAKATDEAAKILTERINVMADGVIQMVNRVVNEATAKVKAAEQEISRVKDGIHYERSFRKFMFWATPVLLLIQSIFTMIAIIKLGGEI